MLSEADVILVFEADIAWIDVAGNAPRSDATVFVIDSDPLKPGMGWSHTDADMICRADAETALTMLLSATEKENLSSIKGLDERRAELRRRHDQWLEELQRTETTFKGSLQDKSTPATGPNALYFLKKVVDRVVNQNAQSQGRSPGSTIWLNETASHLPNMFRHIRLTDDDIDRGSMIYTSGGSGLGWILGASVGISMGGQFREDKPNPDLIVAVVGDGTFIFGIPSAAYWMARRYNTVCWSLICLKPPPYPTITAAVAVPHHCHEQRRLGFSESFDDGCLSHRPRFQGERDALDCRLRP